MWRINTSTSTIILLLLAGKLPTPVEIPRRFTLNVFFGVAPSGIFFEATEPPFLWGRMRLVPGNVKFWTP